MMHIVRVDENAVYAPQEIIEFDQSMLPAIIKVMGVGGGIQRRQPHDRKRHRRG